MKLAQAEVGQAVVYAPYDGCPLSALEEGIITSKNDMYVFVQYKGDFHSKATIPAFLEYVKEAKLDVS